MQLTAGWMHWGWQPRAAPMVRRARYPSARFGWEGCQQQVCPGRSIHLSLLCHSDSNRKKGQRNEEWALRAAFVGHPGGRYLPRGLWARLI